MIKMLKELLAAHRLNPRDFLFIVHYPSRIGRLHINVVPTIGSAQFFGHEHLSTMLPYSHLLQWVIAMLRLKTDYFSSSSFDWFSEV
jgi:hypothetical protein